jgi:hypothetical protein
MGEARPNTGGTSARRDISVSVECVLCLGAHRARQQALQPSRRQDCCARGTIVRCVGYKPQHVQPPHAYGDSRACMQHYGAPVHMPMMHNYHACTARECCSANSTMLPPHRCRRTRIACGTRQQEGSKGRQAPGSCLRQHLPKASAPQGSVHMYPRHPRSTSKGPSHEPAGAIAMPATCWFKCMHCTLRGSRVHPVDAHRPTHAQPCPAMVWNEGTWPVPRHCWLLGGGGALDSWVQEEACVELMWRCAASSGMAGGDLGGVDRWRLCAAGSGQWAVRSGGGAVQVLGCLGWWWPRWPDLWWRSWWPWRLGWWPWRAWWWARRLWRGWWLRWWPRGLRWRWRLGWWPVYWQFGLSGVWCRCCGKHVSSCGAGAVASMCHHGACYAVAWHGVHVSRGRCTQRRRQHWSQVPMSRLGLSMWAWLAQYGTCCG